MARDTIICDTTLRDGEQAPGNAMSPEGKLRLARQLDALGVDVIEAGFPAASQGDLRAVQQVAETVRRPIIARRGPPPAWQYRSPRRRPQARAAQAHPRRPRDLGSPPRAEAADRSRD